MRVPPWATILFFLLLAGAAPALAAGECRASKPPVVKLVVKEGTLDYDYNLGVEQIEALAQKKAKSVHGTLGRVRGLTAAQMQIQFSNGVNIQRLGNNRFCLVLADVTAVLGYTRTTVYVDRRYRRGTCEFNAILDHENTHVKINREMLKRSAPGLKAALEKAVTRVSALVADNVTTGKKQQMALLQKQIAAQIETSNAARDRANAVIDTLASYRATQAKCRNW